MIKHKIYQPIYHFKLEEHNQIKDRLIKLLTAETDKIQTSCKDCNDPDNMTMLDFEYSTDMSRKWVKFFKPFWDSKVFELSKEVGFTEVDKVQIWFQKYHKVGDGHGWHVHGGNFTGVYYLEFGKKSPRTELVDPFTRQIIKMNVKEGDLIFFPSHIYHRCPLVSDNNKKTIVSWNFSILGANPDYKINYSLFDKLVSYNPLNTTIKA
jgi:hypothetical protein|tara:strand:- start:266 stop:889 length:624 start_codon:yes stop_codon:yes gene_type:complete